MPELRRVSSVDVREPAVRYRDGWSMAMRGSSPLACEMDEHWFAGYEAGKRAKADLLRVLAERYGVTFHKVGRSDAP